VKLQRRQFLKLAVLAAVPPTALAAGSTQTYPSRPLRLIVGDAAGGTSDVVAHMTAQWLSRRLGQPVAIENCPGAAGNRAAETVARAPADGHTLLLISAAHGINNAMFAKPTVDLRRDIAPVAAIVGAPMVVAVDPSFPAQTFADLLTYTQARRGWIWMASTGIGSAFCLVNALKIVTDLDVIHVRCPDSARAITDLRHDRVQVLLGATTALIASINAGEVRAVAVTAATRLEALPDVPTIAETIPGYEASDWFGLGAPKGTPADVIDRLNREINAAFSDPSTKPRPAALHGTPLPGSADDFARFIADEIAKWDNAFYRGWYAAVRRYRRQTETVA
jgi:tripartite-type tricarboxylate transporter receptor subunit TctC